jgi:tetratricopeptide (TPR) repeat protein
MPQERSDLDKELADLKREVIEGRNLVIKTDNLLKNLHAELKMVGKRQEDFQKRQWLSSAVAYVLFAVICLVGAIAVSSARVSAVGAERDRQEKTIAELTQKLEAQIARQATADGAAKQASEIFRMMTQLPGDQRLQGIDALAKLDQAQLSELERQALATQAELLRKEIGQAAFERGKTAFRRNDMNGVVTDLTRFLAMNPVNAEALDASFFLGVAHNQLKQHAEAVPLLARFVTEDKRSKSRDYGMLLLAQSYEQTGQPEKAMEVARDALATYPNSEFTPLLKNRLSSAKRTLGGESAAAVAPTPAAPPRAAPAAPSAPAPAAPAVSPAAAAPAPAR